MLTHPTRDKLRTLKLYGMLRALEEQEFRLPDADQLSFEERLGLLVDQELTEREAWALKMRLRRAHLRLDAAVENVDFRISRNLDRAQYLALAGCQWIAHHDNLIVVGLTGTGKTYLTCALGHKACCLGYKVRYWRLSRLLEDVAIARAEGRLPKLLALIATFDLLIVDDWGLAPLTDESRRDILEIIEDRDALRSTCFASQMGVKTWHDYIGDPTLADAILDRLVHNAHKITLKGESVRKGRKPHTAAK